MHLLFVANFAGDTGYAWETIQTVFRRVGERLVADGHRVTVCYPGAADPPAVMRGAPFRFAAFDYARTATPAGALAFARFVRERGVSALYLTDQPTWSPRYPLFRAAGVRRIVVHDRTSGARTERGAPALAVKRALHAVPGLAADGCVAVSEFVRRRLLRVNGTPARRTWRVYNGIDLARFAGGEPDALHRLLGLAPETRVVFCSGRAQPYKGVQVVIDAAARLRDEGVGEGEGVGEVAFVYCGDGPYLDALRRRAAGLGLGNFHFLGRRTDVPRLLGSAAVAVVPSLWAEAFGLTVVEAMAAGVALVATRTGGIPELVEEGRTGLLVEPGDDAALAGALRRLLEHPAERVEMARRARETARLRFGVERVADELYALLDAQLADGRERVGSASPVLVR